MSNTDGKLIEIEFQPGLHRQGTPYAEKRSWVDCDRVRWRQGRPEAMRGRTRLTTASFIGTSRAILPWIQNNGEDDLALGTEAKLYVVQGGALYDVTPTRTSVSVSGALNTTSGATSVICSSAAHGLTTGDYVVFTSQTVTVGGNIYLTGTQYPVSVVDADSFLFVASVTAAATSVNAGNVNMDFLLPTGTSINIGGLGYGAGNYNSGTYNTPRTGVTLFMRRWAFDTWGEDLLANPTGGRIYTWNASIGTSTRATIIAPAVSLCDFIVVSPEARHLVMFGCNDTAGVYQGGLIRWSSSENYADIVASAGNTAGSLFVTGSSRMIGALRGKGTIVFWTDNGVHSLQYRAPPIVFSSFKLGDGCGLIGPHAAIESEGTIYWMAHDNFYVYDGRVSIMDCPLQRDIFNDLNIVQKEKVYAGTNDEFGEIIWLYPAASANECTRYVIFNKTEKTWYWGSTSATTWIDSNYHDSVLTGLTNGYVYYEDQPSVYTDDGAAYESYVSSGAFTLADGDEVLFIDKIVPDFVFINDGVVDLQLTTRKYLTDSATIKGPFRVSAGTRRISMRARGMHHTFRAASSTLNSGWRMGKLRFNVFPDGKR